MVTDHRTIRRVSTCISTAWFETRGAAKRILASEGLKVSSVAGRAAIAEGLGVTYVE